MLLSPVELVHFLRKLFWNSLEKLGCDRDECTLPNQTPERKYNYMNNYKYCNYINNNSDIFSVHSNVYLFRFVRRKYSLLKSTNFNWQSMAICDLIKWFVVSIYRRDTSLTCDDQSNYACNTLPIREPQFSKISQEEIDFIHDKWVQISLLFPQRSCLSLATFVQ